MFHEKLLLPQERQIDICRMTLKMPKKLKKALTCWCPKRKKRKGPDTGHISTRSLVGQGKIYGMPLTPRHENIM